MAKEITTCNYCDCDDLKSILKVDDLSITKEKFELLECFCCGLIHTNPQPQENEIGKYYQSEDYVSHTDTKKGLINNLYHLARKQTLNRKLSILSKYHKKTTLLDIGCGTGYFAEHMQAKGYTVSGMEPDTDTNKIAAKRLGNEVFHSLNQVKGKYKLITMWHVFEHVHDINKTVKTLNTLLEKDGVLIIAVPNPESPDANMYKEYWAAYDVPRHIYHYKKSVIKQIANRHDLKVIDILPMKFDSYYISMLSEKYKGGNIIKAFMNGFISNFKAGKYNTSSLIYIIERK
ncbi:class I SAM-dependent methyltransferase [uncultured Cytophaga sp.]|uniref:class I SAM-dependent methyltransferase n=1 Tax=uncultured Cytophaga sp. TaxID=160238 RepID=UPI002627BAC9|nr:class I SAM-dependent methyltransferase [uncultured Cytophaga sp.]